MSLRSLLRRVTAISGSAGSWGNSASIHTSALTYKAKQKVEKKDKGLGLSLHHSSQAATENEFVAGALKAMSACESQLADELVKRFSSKVDTRVFEEVSVPLDDGKEVRLGHIGRVSLKGPRMVVINLSDSSPHIKAAKLALQKAGSIASNVQQEGVFLYIQVPVMSRQRREELAKDAQKILFNEYKDALNKIYKDYDKKATTKAKTDDDKKTSRNQLLELKRAMEQKGLNLVEAKKKELLTEVL